VGNSDREKVKVSIIKSIKWVALVGVDAPHRNKPRRETNDEGKQSSSPAEAV
jgi:hypothetical protein